LHLFGVYGSEQILIAQIPQNRLGFSLEIGNQKGGLVHRIKEIAITGVVYANTFGSVAIREHLLDWVLARVLQNDRRIFDKEVDQLTVFVDH